MKEKSTFILILVFVIISMIVLFAVNKPKEVLLPVPVVEIEDNGTQEKALVETYVRENIKMLAPEAPVLGGTWYVTDTTIDPILNTGVVMYEDGHIEGKASFSYKIQGEGVVLEDMRKEK